VICRDRSDAGNALQQLSLVLQIRVPIEMIFDGALQPLTFLAQALDRGEYRKFCV
jgi:hypothetical protein